MSAGVRPTALFARLEGMITDPVYEGKSMQGMIDLVNKGYFPKSSKVLYAILAAHRRSMAMPMPSAMVSFSESSAPAADEHGRR